MQHRAVEPPSLPGCACDACRRCCRHCCWKVSTPAVARLPRMPMNADHHGPGRPGEPRGGNGCKGASATSGARRQPQCSAVRSPVRCGGLAAPTCRPCPAAACDMENSEIIDEARPAAERRWPLRGAETLCRSPGPDRAGEAVDCWTNDGWWLGHVHELYDDHITVYFPGLSMYVPVPKLAPSRHAHECRQLLCISMEDAELACRCLQPRRTRPQCVLTSRPQTDTQRRRITSGVDS